MLFRSKTLDCLKKNVPSEVPGIAFLSGGQSEIESSKNLNEINKNRELSISEKNKKERLKKALKENMGRRKEQTRSKKTIKTSQEYGIKQ